MEQPTEGVESSTVTVIIPCYNGSRFLSETLDSVLAQTHPPTEVLVVDDGSTDDSAAIAAGYGPPVRVIRQANLGESVARNRGIDEATGDWIAFLDADDLWKPEKLERQLAAVDGEDVVAVHNNLYYFGQRQGVTHIERVPAELRYSLEHLAGSNTFKGPGSTLLVRRARSPRFPTWTSYGEDHVYCLELVQRGRVQLVEEPLTAYRQHGASQSKSAAGVIGWQRMIERWLAENSELFSIEVAHGVRQSWLRKAGHAARALKDRRAWAEYWKLRQFLESYRGCPEADAVLRDQIYPRWVYGAWDRTVGRLRAARAMARGDSELSPWLTEQGR